MWRLVIALAVLVASQASAQSFTCRYGTRASCLDYGDTVCSSMGKCVDSQAACFESYQCNYEGFTCKSNVSDCIDRNDELVGKYNNLVVEYDDLLEEAETLAKSYDALRTCLLYANDKDDVQNCLLY